MIKDDKIDLTVERKFSSITISKSQYTFHKLFKQRKDKYIDLFFSNFIKRSEYLPWNERKNSSGTYKQKRKNKDWLSDDFGSTLRLTEDNSIMCIGEKPTYKEVLEEYLLETLGFLPYVAYKICMECSKKEIYSVKHRNAFTLCNKHKTYIFPWERRHNNMIIE